MTYSFSERSLCNLKGVHLDLQKLAHKVLDLGLFDFGITCGRRGEEEQARLFHEGRTKVQYPNSKHNQSPSLAFDFMLYIDGKPTWENTDAFYMAIGVFRGVAATMGIKIRSGGDWDGDFNPKDQSFNDLPHIELRV